MYSRYLFISGTMSFKFNFGGKEADPSAGAEVSKTSRERKRAEGKEHFMEEAHLVCRYALI